jgi:hypothetical protein
MISMKTGNRTSMIRSMIAGYAGHRAAWRPVTHHENPDIPAQELLQRSYRETAARPTRPSMRDAVLRRAQGSARLRRSRDAANLTGSVAVRP